MLGVATKVATDVRSPPSHPAAVGLDDLLFRPEGAFGATVETEQNGETQADRRLANAMLHGLPTPEISRKRKRRDQLDEPNTAARSYRLEHRPSLRLDPATRPAGR